MSTPIWQAGRFQLNLSQPLVMGIVNVTPDSFSDGGQHQTTSAALAHCEALLKDGADILDIGGESSRPGAPALSAEEEWTRIGGLVREAVQLQVPISIDTYKTETMARALDAGADIINDIRALGAAGAMELVAAHPNCGVCLMHMQGKPEDMQQAPRYVDAVSEVRQFLSERAQTLLNKGVARERITLDPGYGFGKTPQHNLDLWCRQAELLDLGFPLLIGWSRKSTLGVITGKPVEQRLAASLAAALASIQRGGRIIRVHDVAETVDAIKVWHAAGLLEST
ncbi:dihydropteroate synthase [Aquabacterium sp.]|uniref:dihydropteroate synthase n=1 Tax=Aquabacterium sp. TaxID=1872578 RepID=UPI002E3413BA|nr:dihydropteroate synthase [Aquabacterium sp.]HEX5311525.1 dihydropteroate synthase [Aquabacterium sp.]